MENKKFVQTFWEETFMFAQIVFYALVL